MTKTSPSPEARLKSEKEAERLAGIIAEDHAALIEAQVKGLKKSLELAFELGEHLAEAKETCKIHGHGHWEKWFNNHSFKFSLRSAVRFMKLYGGKERIAQLLETNPPRVAEMTADGELSIRSAEALLKLTDEELATPKPPRTKAEGGKGEGSKGSNSKAAVQPTSSDLKDLVRRARASLASPFLFLASPPTPRSSLSAGQACSLRLSKGWPSGVAFQWLLPTRLPSFCA
jgi:hypothetical protein